MIPKELELVLVSTDDTLGGAVRFKGTRVPVQLLFDYVLTGDSLDEFLANYPEVSAEYAETVLAWERQRVQAAFDLEKAS